MFQSRSWKVFCILFSEVCIYQVKPNKVEEFESFIQEFDTDENDGFAQNRLYEGYWKSIKKCWLVPHDKYLGEGLF